jgi:hypothetical protein
MLNANNCECDEEQFEKFTYDRGKRKGQEWWSYIYRDYNNELFCCTKRDLGECRRACYNWISTRALRRARQYDDRDVREIYDELIQRKYKQA